MSEFVMYMTMTALFCTSLWTLARSNFKNISFIVISTMLIGPIFFYFYPDYGRKGFVYSLIELTACFLIIILFFKTKNNSKLTYKLLLSYLLLILCHSSMTFVAIIDRRDIWTWQYYEYINALLQLTQVFILLSGMSSDRKRFTNDFEYSYPVANGALLRFEHKETMS